MTERDNRTIDEPELERLLREHLRRAVEREPAELDAVARLLAKTADETTAQEAETLLTQDPLTARAAQEIREEDATSTVDAVVSLSAWRRRASVWRALSAGVAAAAVASLFFWRDHEDPGLAPKGAIDRIELSVRRGAARHVLEPREELEKGELVAISYSAARPGHLLVVHVSRDGQTTAIYPSAGSRSLPIAASESIALPDAAELTDGNGCEWFVGIFSDEPTLFAVVQSATQAADRSDPACSLSLDVPGVRAVSAVAILRP